MARLLRVGSGTLRLERAQCIGRLSQQALHGRDGAPLRAWRDLKIQLWHAHGRAVRLNNLPGSSHVRHTHLLMLRVVLQNECFTQKCPPTNLSK